MRGWAGALVACVAACSGAPSCSGTAPIVYVDIPEDLGAPPGPEAPRAKVEAALRAVMEDLPGYAFRAAKADEVAWQLDIRVELARDEPKPDAPGVRHQAAGVRLRLVALKSPKRGPSRYDAEILVRRDASPSAPWSELLAEAIDGAGHRLATALRLHAADPAAVLSALGSEDEYLRGRAVLVAGDRRLEDAVPALMDIVRDEDEVPDVVLKAIGALVAIGDTRATGALIDAGRRKDSAYVAQIVYAVAALGGREAQAWLFTVKSGHPDPQLRRAAEEALDELEARMR